MKPKILAVAALTVAAAQAGAVTLTFDDLAAGSTLSNQYAALGAIFSPNAFNGPGTSSSTRGWATNTGMTIVDGNGNDVQSGGLGTPSLVSGNLLHGFQDWLSADGDPSFRVSFTGAVTSISVDFASVGGEAPDSRLFVYDGATLIGTVAGSTTGQFTLSFAAASITSVVVAPGSFDDWVGIDNVSYTLAAVPVPEPGTWALMALGVAGLLVHRRRRAA